MLQLKDTATPPSTATVSEEDWWRAAAGRWRDTAYGRAAHYATCPLDSHRTCGGAR